MAQAKKTTNSKTKAKTASARASKKSNKPNVNMAFAIMIVVSIFVMFCIYFPQTCGVLGDAVKRFFVFLFGAPAVILPIALFGLSIYLISKKNLKKLSIKSVYVFIATVLVSGIWYIFGNEEVVPLFSAAPSILSAGGCGVFGELVAKYAVMYFGRIIPAIIYILILLCLISLIFKISLIRLIAGFFASTKEESQEVRKQQSYEAGKKARRAVEDATSSTLRTIKNHSIDFDVDDIEISKKKKEEKKKKELGEFVEEASDFSEKPVSDANDFAVEEASFDEILAKIDMETGEIIEEPTPTERAMEIMNEEAGANVSNAPKREEPLSAEQEKGLRAELDSNAAKEPIYYEFPPLRLLAPAKKRSSDTREELKETANKLVSTLKSFGVDVKLSQVSRGPVVTRYELQPSVGVKVSKITNLSDDIALNLAATAVRIEAPIPGKAAIGIEIPNKEVSAVTLREVIETEEFKSAKSKLSVAMGMDITGKPVIGDIAKMPHVLIAGATGSGKSVCINSIIASILYKADPNEVKLILIDPKVVELQVYNGIPHLLIPVVTEPKKASGALGWAVSEMVRRYNLFAENGVRDLVGYNEVLALDGEPTLPQIVIVVDELADLMMVAPKEIEDSICRLAQMARAAGMHLIVATQRPSVNVITGVIKANIPSRIAFAVSSQIDSRTILDGAGAEKLLGKGDMLFMPMGASKPKRLQGAFVTDKEVEAIVDFVKGKSEAKYDEDITEKINAETQVDSDMEDCDELLPKAIEIAIASGSISTSMVQRRLGVGYARAGRIIDQMEARGIISGADGAKPRNVLVSSDDLM